MSRQRIIEANGRAVADMFAALDTRTADERQTARLEQLGRDYVAERITLEDLEAEIGRTLGIPEPQPEPRSYGPLLHVAVILAGAAAWAHRWRRQGRPW